MLGEGDLVTHFLSAYLNPISDLLRGNIIRHQAIETDDSPSRRVYKNIDSIGSTGRPDTGLILILNLLPIRLFPLEIKPLPVVSVKLMSLLVETVRLGGVRYDMESGQVRIQVALARKVLGMDVGEITGVELLLRQVRGFVP